MITETATVAITGMNAGESPQPGPAIARSLRYAPEFRGRLVGLLYDAMESGIYSEGLINDAFVMPYPSAGSDALLARIEAVHRTMKIDVLMPTLDAELPAYIRLEPRIRELGIRMFVPTEEQLEARSKQRLADMTQRLDIPSLRQKLVSTIDQLTPLFAEFGGSVMVKGLYYEAASATNLADAHKIAGKISAKWGFPLILQERVTGEEYCLALLGNGEGDVIGQVAMRKMALTEKGKAFSGMTVTDPDLFAIGQTFVRETKWRGPLELEFVKASRDGKYYLIEVNPRFPAWIYLASQVGQNLPWAVVRLALGETVDAFPDYTAGRFFVRHAIDVVADLHQLEQLSTTGELHA